MPNLLNRQYLSQGSGGDLLPNGNLATNKIFGRYTIVYQKGNFVKIRVEVSSNKDLINPTILFSVGLIHKNTILATGVNSTRFSSFIFNNSFTCASEKFQGIRDDTVPFVGEAVLRLSRH